ncbi:hypothetical protein NE865_01529 [Phthorimaea operculella]|nr:hypothetical protein NE865_01529 [Phthorimaea operculella]
MGRSAADVRALAGVLESEGRKVGLRVNQDKTEYLHMRRFKTTRTKRNNLIVNGSSYKGVDKFKYLGCTVTDTNQREDEINIRIQNALRCSAALHKEEEKLLVAERKILRKILGPVKNEDGIWRIRKNKEIEDIVREPNIIGESKAARLRWLGHVERMEEDRAVKKAYLGRPMGKRPVGRPRYRWTDEVIKDLHALQKPDWKQTAQNREEWRAVVSEAKIHFGSLSQRSKYFGVKTRHLESIIF